MGTDFKKTQSQNKRFSLGKKLRIFIIKLIKSVFKVDNSLIRLCIKAGNAMLKKNKQGYKKQQQKRNSKQGTGLFGLVDISAKLKQQIDGFLTKKRRIDKIYNKIDDLKFMYQIDPNKIAAIDLLAFTKALNSMAVKSNYLDGSRSTGLNKYSNLNHSPDKVNRGRSSFVKQAIKGVKRQ